MNRDICKFAFVFTWSHEGHYESSTLIWSPPLIWQLLIFVILLCLPTIEDQVLVVVWRRLWPIIFRIWIKSVLTNSRFRTQRNAGLIHTYWTIKVCSRMFISVRQYCFRAKPLTEPILTKTSGVTKWVWNIEHANNCSSNNCDSRASDVT